MLAAPGRRHARAASLSAVVQEKVELKKKNSTRKNGSPRVSAAAATFFNVAVAATAQVKMMKVVPTIRTLMVSKIDAMEPHNQQ